jgi:hypothetical protein
MASKRYSGRLVIDLIQVENFTAYSVRIRLDSMKGPLLMHGRFGRDHVGNLPDSEEWALDFAAQAALHRARRLGVRSPAGETIEQLAEVHPYRTEYGMRAWLVSRTKPAPRENPYHPRNPKIDLFDKRSGQYLASTRAFRTVREAVATATALRDGRAVTGRIDRGAR